MVHIGLLSIDRTVILHSNAGTIVLEKYIKYKNVHNKEESVKPKISKMSKKDKLKNKFELYRKNRLF